MTNQPLRILVFTMVSGFATLVQAQTIETPANTALTITSDMNLNSGKSVQVDGTNFIKLAPASSGNVFMGNSAGAAATPGLQNTFVGFQTGQTNTGSNNTFLGYQAGKSNQGGGFNVFIGFLAGQNNSSGQGNLFLGQQAGSNNAAGSYNLFMGNGAGSSNVSGAGNVAIGDGAGYLTKGTNNAFIGRFAGYSDPNGVSGVNATGDENAFIGFAAGYYNTTGTGNVGIGRGAGATNTSGGKNTFIGYKADASTSGLNNAVAIGQNAIVGASNAIALGGIGANAVNVGIGTSTPANTFHVATAFVANTVGIRLPVTSGAAAQATGAGGPYRYLLVNGSGDVVTGAQVTTSTREGVTESSSYWQTSGDNIVNTNEGGVVIGSGIAKTPVGYKLYVAGGMLTEKVKVALRNKSEWSDYVFEKGYKLAPLSEVSAFIKVNGHLPGVPSADEMVSEGLDVAKMNAKLLEKVEELTLYMLNQQKQIQKLQNDNKTFKQQLKSRR